MKPNSGILQEIPLKIVGSSNFGRYPKISNEQTFNMTISDGWLVNHAGYKQVLSINPQGQGRGIFNSARWNHLIVVIDNKVFAVTPSLTYNQIGTLNTFSGDVFIDENNNYQIAICDKQTIYIYNWQLNTFVTATLDGATPLDFQPGYITYQDSYLIAANISTTNNPATWRLSKTGDASQFPSDAQHTGALQTKPDFAVAVQRMPGRGNLLLVFGGTVTEFWTDVGAQLFPYQRSPQINIDYGCLSAATIASDDKIVAFLGANEKSGPVIMYTTGGDVQQISTDGINYRLSQLVNPSLSYAFFYKQNGHSYYQITFPDPADNLTLTYDFTEGKFYTLTDENMNYHIAKRVAFFNENYYFVSFNDGNLYQLSSNFTTYDYGDRVEQIPRVRVCQSVRLPDSSRFLINNLTFMLEQGTDPSNTSNSAPAYNPRIDLSVSKDGGYTWSSSSSKSLNAIGNFRNRVVWWGLGAANDFVPQFRFWTNSRTVVFDGIVGIYQ